jgi:colanic acid/amylovoran biosynthesis glycosyltransferase
MATNQSQKAPCIAYLMSQYPAISHTFFLNEVRAMREQGFKIETASVNSIQPPTGGFPAVEMEEAGRTFYIKERSKVAILGVLARTIVTRPGVVARGLAVSLRLRPLDIPGTGYALFYLLEAILLGDWMRRKGCTHLHVHFGGPVATVGMLASIAWKIPYSLTIHGPEEFYDVAPSFLEKKIGLATFVTCISHFCRSQLWKISPEREWSKFHVCRLGVRTEVFAPMPAADRDVLHIVSVGRLHPAKGQMVLLHSFRELLQRGLRIRLSIVGDGAGLPALKEFIQQNGMEGVVTLHGALSHPATRELLGTADLFVLASFAEGVPVALMEAMSMEVACISSYVAGIPELITSGEEGLLVPASSEEDLTAAIAALVLDPEKRHTLASARHKVLSKYDLSTNIKFLVQVFGRYGLAARKVYEPSAATVSVATANRS